MGILLDLRNRLILNVMRFRYWLLQPYTVGLMVQAKYIYQSSELYRSRALALGIEFAEESFDGDAVFFYHKAQKEDWYIRLWIFIDATLGREPKPYTY